MRHISRPQGTISIKIVVIAILIFLVALLEFTLRVYAKQSPPQAFIPDAEIFWILSSNLTNLPLKIGDVKTVIDTNSSHMRSPQISISRKERSFRVVCLGDEETFGIGIAQNNIYPAILQNLIRKRFHYYITDVINAGCPGYTTYQSKIFLQKYCIKYKPDIVVVNLLYNDLSLSFAEDKDRLPPKFLQWAYSKVFDLKTFNLIRNMYIENMYKEYERGNLAGSIRRVSPADYRKNLTDILHISQKAGAKVIFVIPPRRNRKEPYNYRKILSQVSQKAYNVDLEWTFKLHPEYYQKGGNFPNKSGHKAIAQAIFETIKRNSMIPQRPGGKVFRGPPKIEPPPPPHPEKQHIPEPPPPGGDMYF